jgi:hypothetical protein
MIKTETKRAVAYVRVSSMSQVEGHSLAALYTLLLGAV